MQKKEAPYLVIVKVDSVIYTHTSFR